MTYAVFGRLSEATLDTLHSLLHYFDQQSDTILIHKFLIEGHEQDYSTYTIFDKTYDFSKVDLAISIGGDGTFIRLSQMVAPFNVPILGVNTGRLGFLADIHAENIISTLVELKEEKCNIEERTLLELSSSNNCHKGCNLAVNEIAVLRRDTSSLLVANLYGDGKFINSYWADGLIISTPTGSTAYSMAAGGPIVTPESNNLIITPISPHSLTVRPLVISSDVVLTIEVESRADNYMVSVDSRSEIVDISEKLTIKQSPFILKMIIDTNHAYYATLRGKLMWGKDKRS
jgi:NAD+ kinase